jgi:hypothetical protein
MMTGIFVDWCAVSGGTVTADVILMNGVVYSVVVVVAVVVVVVVVGVVATAHS